MIYWKNKTIKELSNSELRQALSEAVLWSFDRKVNTNVNDIYSTFIYGLLAGMLISIFGIFFSFNL